MTDWIYGGVRIFTQDMTTDDGQIIARLNPIGGGTVLQVFGYDDLIVKINAYVVGIDDISTLRSLTTSGISFNLFSPHGPTGYPYLLNKITAKEIRNRCQTLRSDLAEDSAVYIVDMELYKDF